MTSERFYMKLLLANDGDQGAHTEDGSLRAPGATYAVRNAARNGHTPANNIPTGTKVVHPSP